MIEVERLLGTAANWIAPATIFGAVTVGLVVGLGPAFLVLAGGILLGAVILLWSSLGRLTGDSPLTLDEAIGLAAPSAEEERKRAVVRALKDLDYERSVGKISEEDYADLSARYRVEAKALLQSLETGLSPIRKTVEKRLNERLKAEGIAEKRGNPDPAPEKRSEDASDAPNDDAAASASSAGECSKCGTANDTDAVFCKRCGLRLLPETAT
jgi:hypothetical protein